MRAQRDAWRFISFAACLVGSAWASSINVALQASFNAPSYLLELLETAALENSTCYFPLLHQIAQGSFEDSTTEKELYEEFLKVLKTGGHLSDPEALSSFQLALSIHAAAPRIEAHYQYYDTTVEPLLTVAQDAACPVWVHYQGKQYCTPALERAQQDYQGPKNQNDLPFDRRQGLVANAAVATLYGDLSSPLFGEFHKSLSEKAEAGQLVYRVRYRPVRSDEDRPLVVGGYGVELSLKRTDYIVIDDRESGDGKAKKRSAQKVLSEDEEIEDLKPLSASELLGLGMKASTYVMNSKNPLDALEKLTQDFPKHSSAIADMDLDADFENEHHTNRRRFLQPGFNVIFMNGLQVEPRRMDAFNLLNKLRHERKLINRFKKLGLTPPEAINLISNDVITQSKASTTTSRFDFRDDIEGGNVIIWANDIENDKRYENWTSNAAALLQPGRPGQMPTVKRDIHNFVLPLNLTDVSDLEEAFETIPTLIGRKIPIRFGIVPIANSPEELKQAKIAYYVYDKYGLPVLMEYLEATAKDAKTQLYTELRLSAAVADKDLREDEMAMAPNDVFDGEEYTKRTDASLAYLKRLGASGASPPFFVNGAVVPRGEAWLQVASQRIGADLQMLQSALFEEQIPEDAWLAGFFIEDAMTHRNDLIVPEDDDEIRIADLTEVIEEHHTVYEALPKIAADKSARKKLWSNVIVVADIDSARGRDVLNQALEFRKTNKEAEIIILHNAADETELNYKSAKLFEALEKKKDFSAEDIEKVIGGDSGSKIDPEKTDAMAETYWQRMQPLVHSMGFRPGENGVLFNGRIVGPLKEDDVFDVGALNLLATYEQSKRIKPVYKTLTDLGLEKKLESPLKMAQLTSLVAISSEPDTPEGIFGSAPSVRMNTFNKWASKYTAIEKGNKKTAPIQIVASIDPTNEVAQRWVPMLKTLSDLDGVYLKLYLNPKENLQELPIKRFYRYLMGSKPTFQEDGSLVSQKATFAGLPKNALLSLAMDVPPAWFVTAKESVHDLDNIKLSSIKSGADINAVYEIENILIEGHTRDTTNLGDAPKGAQLLLGTEKNAHTSDTLIMANLGYFQFKANPGHWSINLKPGRSEQIFTIDSIGAEGVNDDSKGSNTDVTLMSFQGLTIYPRLSRKEGMQNEDVLEDFGSSNEYVGKASKFASGFLSNLGLGKKTEHADINIFSVASGHLYERMLNIMMVSVMKHTKRSVKFWFIEQFLSPSFKKSISTLAEEFGFQYEMVSYKWPHWLRGQKEKQREIWGYKILFLDVLFPLSLDKVIFVDADQIVRTDMHELVNLDLEGAPYGFTPMCDSRTEMEGFRFWKQGYWKNFLRGKPYHISALYVVDLKLFRGLAAGDRLRQQYQQLSADPGSLANLDQDLPNNMQSQLPIHSLPQEWLWCETWCSDESLADAKTIDLCQNPQTKEPKLDRARRQVPEWTVYDDEIAEVFRKKRVEEAGDEEADEGDTAGEEGVNVQEELDKQDYTIKDEL